jgi:hypothetical protein
MPGVGPGGAPRDVVTVTDVLSSVVSTVPSWSVLATREEWARRRSMVAAFGWPYVFLAPTEMTATAGRTVASRASDEAVALP